MGIIANRRDLDGVPKAYVRQRNETKVRPGITSRAKVTVKDEFLSQMIGKIFPVISGGREIDYDGSVVTFKERV